MTGWQAPSPDSLQAVVDSVFTARAYAWPEEVDLLAPVRRFFQGALAWLWNLQGTRPAAYWALIVAMLVVLAAILTHAAWIFRRTLRTERRAAGPAHAPAVARTAAWHLAEARRLAEAGAYADALSHRFQATLRVLEGRRVIRLRHDRTPAEYARESRLDPDGRDRFGLLVGAFYDVVFGHRPCDLEMLRRFDGQALDVERSHAAG